MRSCITLAAVVVLAALPAVSNGDNLLWDNCPGGIAAAQDPNFCMTSERNTAVWESTWTVDDVDLAQTNYEPSEELQITRLEWYGARDDNYTYSQVDVIILDENFNTIAEFTDLPYQAVDQGMVLNSGLNVYEGSVDLPTPSGGERFVLPEHFYIGARLAGDGMYMGANRFVTSSIDDTVRGLTEGYTRAAIFGAPTWEPSSTVWYAQPPNDVNFEFAFRVYTNVPEPGCVALLVIGGLFIARRR